MRVAFGARILDERGELLAEATTVHACTRLDERPRRVPDEVREALMPFVVESAG